MQNRRLNIKVIEDNSKMSDMLCELLVTQGYDVEAFLSASSFLETKSDNGDLIVSDITMPGISGYDLCKTVRATETCGRTPIILLSGSDPITEKARGIEAGADDFISKPFSLNELRAKIQSLLNIRLKEMEAIIRADQLSRFLSPNLGEIVTPKNRNLLLPHRAEVSVMFIDLRGYTALVEKLGEAVMEILSEYYSVVGTAAMKYGGTLGHLAGDGVMVFFNDPKPIENHREQAVKMAIETRTALECLRNRWNECHYDIDFGIGLADGIATIGGIGFEKFSQYSVIGSVTNMASRLCDVADRGQILISKSFADSIQIGICKTESVGHMTFKGIENPVPVQNILSAA